MHKLLPSLLSQLNKLPLLVNKKIKKEMIKEEKDSVEEVKVDLIKKVEEDLVEEPVEVLEEVIETEVTTVEEFQEETMMPQLESQQMNEELNKKKFSIKQKLF